MSKVVIAGDASGTGTFTISAPNGNTDRTLVLPDEAGTVLTTAGVPASAMPAGSIVQVVNGTPMTNVFATTSTSYVDVTGLNATITPLNASSKILAIVFLSDFVSLGTSYDTALRIALLRNSTIIQEQTNQLFGYNASSSRVGNSTIMYVDSPATTSSVTYKVQLHSRTGSQVEINTYWSTAKSSVILMEIAQ